MNLFRKRAVARAAVADGPPAEADRPDAGAGAQPPAVEQMRPPWTGLQRGKGQDEDEFEGEGWTFWGL